LKICKAVLLNCCLLLIENTCCLLLIENTCCLFIRAKIRSEFSELTEFDG